MSADDDPVDSSAGTDPGAANEQIGAGPDGPDGSQRGPRQQEPSPPAGNDGPKQPDPTGDGARVSGVGFRHTRNLISGEVRSANVWQADNIIVDKVEFSSTGETQVWLRADVTRHAESEAPGFVEPPNFLQLVEATSEHSLALVVAPRGSGRRSAALQALRRCEYEQLLQLPADTSARDLVAEICRTMEEQSAGFLVESVDLKMLRALASFGAHSLQGQATKVRAGVVFITDPSVFAAAPRLADVPTIWLGYPDTSAVLGRRLEQAGRASDVDALAKALELLPSPVPPSVICEVVETVDCTVPFDPVEVAARFRSDRSEAALDGWLGDGRPAVDVAMLASATALAGLPVGDVYRTARHLTELLEEDNPNADDHNRAGRADIRRVSEQWPSDVVALSTEVTATHFGEHEVQAIGFCPPHNAQWTLEFLWTRLGPDFRNPFVDWLVELAGDVLYTEAAAITAGRLFTIDPVTVERHILGPWSNGSSARSNFAAGYALGIPAVVGADGAGARALARWWSTSNDPNLVRSAIFAYGGLLGAWDEASSGPARLIEIGRRHPDLCLVADAALATLMAAGGDAVRVRSTLVGLLENLANDYRQAERAYRILPQACDRLCDAHANAAESFESFFSERERTTLQDFAALLAKALLAAPGHDMAHRALASLIIAVTNGEVGEEPVIDLIRQMKQMTTDRERLGTQLRRSLVALKRNNHGNRDLADTTDRFMETFFGRRNGDQH